MVHRFFLRRFLFLALMAALLVGGARALFGAGYRQGFVQGSLLAAGDGQAVTIAPEVAFRSLTHGGLGPLEMLACGLPLALLGLGLMAFLFATGARRHGPGQWARHHGHALGGHAPHGWGHPAGAASDIGPEKSPEDYV